MTAVQLLWEYFEAATSYLVTMGTTRRRTRTPRRSCAAGSDPAPGSAATRCRAGRELDWVANCGCYGYREP